MNKNKINITVQDFLFDEEDRASLRSLEISGETLIVAKDVCKVLGIRDHHQALHRLYDDERAMIQVSTAGGNQRMSAITESGLYHLIFISRTPKAKVLRKRITSRILPRYTVEKMLKKLQEICAEGK